VVAVVEPDAQDRARLERGEPSRAHVELDLPPRRREPREQVPLEQLHTPAAELPAVPGDAILTREPHDAHDRDAATFRATAQARAPRHDRAV